MTRVAARVALQAWIVLFIVFFGAEVVHLEPALRSATQLLYGVPLVAWAALRLRGPADRLEWLVLGGLVVYVAICLVSRDPVESIGTAGLAAAYAAWFMLTRRAFAADALGRHILVATATGLTLTLAFNTFLAIREKLDWYEAVGAAPLEGVVTFPWESVNTLPVLILLAVPFIALLDRGPVRLAMTVVGGASSVILLPISQGRAGYVAIAVAVVTLVALQPAVRRRVAALPTPVRWIGAGGVAAVVLIGLFVAGPRLVDGLGSSGRLLIWEQGVNMFASSSLVGLGPGVYSWTRLEFPPAAADLLALRLVHDVPLLTLIEGGVILGTVMAVLVGWWALLASRGASEWGQRERTVVAALVGFAVASLLDDFSYLPSVIAMVLALAAYLVPSPPVSPTRGWVAPAVLAAVAVAALPGIVAIDVARSAAQAGRTAMIAGAHAEAVAAFESAVAWHPQSGASWLGLGMALAYAGDDARAAEAYERATVVAPGDSRGFAGLAAFLPEREVELLEAATERTLDDPRDGMRLGLALVERGDLDGATRAWAGAVALRPEILPLLPFEASGVSMAKVIDAAISAIHADPRPAPQENLEALWNLALVRDELPADADPAWRAVDAARAGDLVEARRLANEAISIAPWEAKGYQAEAAVAAFACDPDAEARALRTERRTRNAYQPPDPDPVILREFVYREASLGTTMPPAARVTLDVERWPWPFVDRPACP